MSFFALSITLQIAIICGLLLVVVFVTFLGMVVRREQRAAHGRRPSAGQGTRATTTTTITTTTSERRTGGAWEGADAARAARGARPRYDDELPALELGDTQWRELSERAQTQSNLVANTISPGAPGVYKTGFNPFFRSAETDIEVEEVADLVQQATLMCTLANYPEAISMLTRHIRETEKPAPKAWLMLFDLYAKTARMDQYANLAQGFRILFNAEVPSWNRQLTEASKSLEAYPQVMTKVQRLWGLPSCRAFLESLLYDDRGGNRQGFMLTAYSDIIFLLEVIDAQAALNREQEERQRIEQKLSVNARH